MPVERSLPVEVEWQFDAPDLAPVARWLAVPRLLRGGPAVSAVAGTTRNLVDRYFETADWRIQRAGFSLRVRHRSGRAGRDEATLKDVAPASAGLRRRVELTEPVGRDGLGAIAPEGPVGSRVRALAGNRPLEQLFEVRTRRQPFTLLVGGTPVGEVALDETTIAAAGPAPAQLRRVEVELDPGHLEVLTPFVQALRDECALAPAALSKFEMGLRAGGAEAPPAPTFGPSTVKPDDSLGEVAYAVLRRHFAALLEHEPGTRLGDDVEELHVMRVATRRLRAVLDLFAGVLPPRARHLRDELGWLGGRLGSVRDLDVQLAQLEEWIATVPEADRPGLAELRTVLEAHRHEARGPLLEALDSARYGRLVVQLSSMLRRGALEGSPETATPAALTVPALVDAHQRTAVKAARRAARSGLPSDFHRLRVRCKRLRYALESVAELSGPRTAPYIRRVVGLQDALGALQDAEVAGAELRRLALGGDPQLPAATLFTMGTIAERYRDQADRLHRRLPRQLGALRGRRWKRLQAAMEKARRDTRAGSGRRRRARHPERGPVPPGDDRRTRRGSTRTAPAKEAPADHSTQPTSGPVPSAR